MPKHPNALRWAHPLVQQWFSQYIGRPSAPQREGWPPILAKKTTLISAPTGSGKTLAAFLACIDQLVRKAIQGTLKDETEVLYISPLKALSHDIQKNLMEPLQAIAALAQAQGLTMQEIRVAVRTGDTLPRERQAMLKKPPHILVTTPESFYILLTAAKSRLMLASVKTVIVDEIHAVADDKRGAHLALSLERLEGLANAPMRIGLSATQKPIERVAHFLTGNHRKKPTIVNIGHIRQLELNIEVPRNELGPVASNEMWDEIYDRLAELARENRSTLIFVNTRRLAERAAHHLSERLGEATVAVHHGSLSRKLRLEAERKLKQGELKALVATASLELGIDIGSIDLVCQLGSPRSIAVALQRIGRAGHWHGATSKGRIFVTTRDELAECAALVYAIKEGDLDKLIIPDQPLDILAQQIVATVATEDWREDDLFALVKSAYPYGHLERETFDQILQILSEGIAASRGRYGAYLFRDRVNGLVKARRGSRLTAITSGGAIPETGLFTMVAEPHETVVGTLDEDFAVESNRGDIILLGTTSWRIKRVESARGRVLVEDAKGAPPSVPFWRGEAPARTDELSLQLSLLRERLNKMLPIKLPNPNLQQEPAVIEAIAWLENHCGLDRSGAEQLIEYLLQGRGVLGDIPTQKTVIAERFFDEAGGMQLIIHAPFGARINKAWGLALRKRFCRSFNFELQAAATDNGLNIALAEQHSFPLADVFKFLHSNSAKAVVTQAVLQSPLFATRFRWDAMRSLALVRFRGGKKVPPNILRMRADDLMAAVFPDAAACQDNLAGRDVILPDHPLVNEAIKDALTEALDVDGFLNVLNEIEAGHIQCKAIDTPLPSVFSHEILNANPYAYLDDAPLEERRARAVEMRRMLPETVLQEVGKLDGAAIQEVQQQAWPDIRSADELHDVLQTLIAFPTTVLTDTQYLTPGWEGYFNELASERRGVIATVQDKTFWVTPEKICTFQCIYPDARLPADALAFEQTVKEPSEAILDMLRGWLLHTGPVTAAELAHLLFLPLVDIERALVALETTGLILRGQFRNNEVLEWCERRLLARIHRLTLGILRKEIEPVNAAQFMRWLLKWQHIAPDTQLSGEQGLLEIVRQLQGFEMPANAWEKLIFSKRLRDYDPMMLDYLCLSGAIGWGRISPHPAMREEELLANKRKKRITPTSVVPITFFLREESAWMSTQKEMDQADLTSLSKGAQNIFSYLKQYGASFLTDIVRVVGGLKTEAERSLWELVAAGIITADAFDNLRSLIDPRRRISHKRRRTRFQYSSGRWSLLPKEGNVETPKQYEAICWMLLKRYGVVFRDLVAREKNIPRWRELLVAFRRLEDRGEIRGGRFVSGFIGEQFALPYAVGSLRAIKKELPSGEVIELAAVDPLNLVGIILPGQRMMATSHKKITLQDGENVTTSKE